MPRKILDLRRFPGLPQFLAFNDDDCINKPYSSWDLVNNSRKLVHTNMYRRYDVIFSSSSVRNRCMAAIWRSECVIAHCALDTAPCVVYLFDVAEPGKFVDCCKWATFTEKDYALIIHETSGVYQIVSGKGTEVFGYLEEDLTYERRRFRN